MRLFLSNLLHSLRKMIRVYSSGYRTIIDEYTQILMFSRREMSLLLMVSRKLNTHIDTCEGLLLQTVLYI